MAVMARYPDGYFDLAIVDPPYFSGPDKFGYYGERVSSVGVKRDAYPKIGTWEVPGAEYFKELFRVSQHQIIWGCNYYAQHIPHVGRIVWDKVNYSSTFSDAELASCSLHNSVRLFRYMWNGMLQGKSLSEGAIAQGNKALNERRIHPTQKPIKLYEWLLRCYAKPEFRILDTHLGSASSAIAAYHYGVAEFVGAELDEQYYASALKRFNLLTSQTALFAS